MFKKREKGFTLIELMVVIAIIAILATVVLVALNTAREAARDSNRKMAIAQIRSLAEVEYAINQNYEYLPTNDEVMELLAVADYVAQNIAVNVSADHLKYCATIDLESGGYFCVDDENVPGTTHVGETACTGEDDAFRCVSE